MYGVTRVDQQQTHMAATECSEREPKDGPTQALTTLNERRRRAFQLRLAGQTQQQIRSETGLSAPTVIGAYKLFWNHGRFGVAVHALGRRLGQRRVLSAAELRFGRVSPGWSLTRQLLVAQTLRGSTAWLAPPDAYSIQAYTGFLERLAISHPTAPVTICQPEPHP